MKKETMERLQDAELFAQQKVLILQKELRSAQSDLVGVREELRTVREEYRISELAKVRPVYGRREELIDNLKERLSSLLKKVDKEDSDNQKRHEECYGNTSRERHTRKR